MIMLYLIPIFLAAALTGLFFFGGLRYSTGKMIRSTCPWAWALGSFIIRTGVGMTVLYVLAGNSVIRWLVCLAGFLAGRTAIMRDARQKEVRHATEPR